MTLRNGRYGETAEVTWLAARAPGQRLFRPSIHMSVMGPSLVASRAPGRLKMTFHSSPNLDWRRPSFRHSWQAKVASTIHAQWADVHAIFSHRKRGQDLPTDICASPLCPSSALFITNMSFSAWIHGVRAQRCRSCPKKMAIPHRDPDKIFRVRKFLIDLDREAVVYVCVKGQRPHWVAATHLTETFRSSAGQEPNLLWKVGLCSAP
jgi:hypothetical protein